MTLPAPNPEETDMNSTMERTRDDLAADTAPRIERAKARVEEMAARSADRMRDLRDDVLERADRYGTRTAGYVKDEPMKSLLMAAALGAAVALLARALSSRRY